MGLERYLLWFWESEGKGARFNLHLFARSIRSRLFNVHIREAPGGERRCSNRFLSNSVSPPCPLKPMDALWKLFADVWWWSVSVMVYIHNAMEQGLPLNHLLELKKKALQQLVESVVVGPAPLVGADLHQLLGVSGAAFRSNSLSLFTWAESWAFGKIRLPPYI